MNSIAKAKERKTKATAKKKKQSSQNLGSKVTADDDNYYDNFVS